MSDAHIDFSKLTTLVVDDSRLMRSLVEAILKSYGCRNVVLAESVSHAGKLLEHDSN